MIKLFCSIHTQYSSLLPHFIKHYRKYGVHKFIFGIWRGENNPIWDAITEQFKNEPVTLIKSYDEHLDGAKECIFWNRCRKTMFDENEWYIVADLDEFFDFRGYEDVNALIEDLEAENADYIGSFLIDRTTMDGSIPRIIKSKPSIWEQFPNDCNITEELGGSSDKVMLARQPVPIRPGHHAVGSQYKASSMKALTYHFKWFGDLMDKELWKAVYYKQKGFRFFKENVRLVERLMANRGKLF